MIQLSVLALTLCAGTLVEPFRIAEAEPGHNQRQGCAAMASDGHFAVAWIDGIASGDPDPDDLEPELFIRFFDRDGNPMTEAYKITKLADTTWIRYPCLEMDTAGNTILLWEERKTQDKEEPSYVRFQRFAPDGSPVGSAHTVVARAFLGKSTYKLSSIDLSLNNNEEFVVTWCEIELGPPTYKNYVWVGRFDLEGDPEDRAFLTHDIPGNYLLPFTFPRVALNDEGDLVVTWRDKLNPDTVYRRFQVFDAADEPILSWRPRGHRLDEREDGGREAEFFWLDNDRFVTFFRASKEYYEGFLEARVFAHRGLASYPPCLVITDPYRGWTWEKRFSVALSSDERFAETHLRYSKLHEEPVCWWTRPGGIIGEIRDKEVWRQTNLFEYTTPFGIDTTLKISWFTPVVGVCDDRIVWVYPHSTPDSLCEAWVLISDWDMGVGVVEQPIVEKPPDWEVITSIGSQIVLRYQDRPDGFRASIFDASGRKVDEVHATESSGMITWGRCYGCYGPGVYFIVPSEGKASAQKVVLIK